MAADRRHHPAAPEQSVSALRVHDQVEIALAIAQLDIRETVIFLGEGAQPLRENRNIGGVDRELAARRPPNQSFDTDQITDVQQPHHSKCFGTEKIPVAKDLYLP